MKQTMRQQNGWPNTNPENKKNPYRFRIQFRICMEHNTGRALFNESPACYIYITIFDTTNTLLNT